MLHCSNLRSGLHPLSIPSFEACSVLEIVLATPSARYEVMEAALLKIKVSGFVFVIRLILLQTYYLILKIYLLSTSWSASHRIFHLCPTFISSLFPNSTTFSWQWCCAFAFARSLVSNTQTDLRPKHCEGESIILLDQERFKCNSNCILQSESITILASLYNGQSNKTTNYRGDILSRNILSLSKTV